MVEFVIGAGFKMLPFLKNKTPTARTQNMTAMTLDHLDAFFRGFLFLAIWNPIASVMSRQFIAMTTIMAIVIPSMMIGTR